MKSLQTVLGIFPRPALTAFPDGQRTESNPLKVRIDDVGALAVGVGVAVGAGVL